MNCFSIRSYSKQIHSHFHHYHQLVLPLHGSIDIKVGKFQGLVSLGDCVIIKSGQRHDFRAPEEASFIVVDLKTLPENIMTWHDEKITIDTSLLAFVQFVEKQLQRKVDHALESSMFTLFYQLLSQQTFAIKIDKRIAAVISIITEDLSPTYTNETLAQHACLSITQFKKVFKNNMGMTTQSYISQLRMEKAKALLSHTDTPINLVAEYVGYQSPSAFSRKFKAYFGSSPKDFIQ